MSEAVTLISQQTGASAHLGCMRAMKATAPSSYADRNGLDL
jgi:hypothetical protein